MKLDVKVHNRNTQEISNYLGDRISLTVKLNFIRRAIDLILDPGDEVNGNRVDAEADAGHACFVEHAVAAGVWVECVDVL